MNVSQRAEITSAVARSAEFLRQQFGTDGFWRDFQTLAGESTEWVTGFVCVCATRAGVLEEEVVTAVRALLRSQRRDGGWGYNRAVPTDCDSTAWCLLALAASHRWRPSAISRAIQCIQARQLGSGGFGTYAATDGIERFIGADELEIVRGWLAPHVCVTAVATEALAVAQGTQSADMLTRATKYLREQRDCDGLWRSQWWEGTAYASLFALRSLWATGNRDPRLARLLVRRLRERQSTDGSWAQEHSAEGTVFATSLIILTLVFTGDSQGVTAAQAGARWLMAQQQADGSWRSAPILRVVPPSSLDPEAVKSWQHDSLGTGVIIRDHRRNFTTATALWALASVARVSVGKEILHRTLTRAISRASRATPEGGLAARTRARHTQIHAALARGLTITEISRTLGLERKTVRRYATAMTAGQMIQDARLTRPGLLGPHQSYLQQRWDEGVRSTKRLHAELRAMIASALPMPGASEGEA